MLTGLASGAFRGPDAPKRAFAAVQAGGVIFKNAQHSRATFHLLPDYLQDMPREQENINFYDYGIQLTRGFRALKLWMALRFYGIETYRALVDRSLDLTQVAALLMRRSSVLEVFNEPQLGVVCFRYVPYTPQTPEDE